MAESSRRYNLRDTRKKPQGVLLKRWEVEYSKLINNEKRRIPLETAKTAIRSAFEDGMFEQWRITLKCPLSGQRIIVPARYADCTHIECFDLEAFLRMKTQKNLQVCPICQKEVEKPLTNLRIDNYIENVLSKLPDAMQIELMPDGSFKEIYGQVVVEPNVIDDEEPYVQDNNMPAFNEALKSEVKQEVVEDGDEYITLSDEEEIMEEITVVDTKPIFLMPLVIDSKPNITPSSEPEQTHSAEEEIQSTPSDPNEVDRMNFDLDVEEDVVVNFSPPEAPQMFVINDKFQSTGGEEVLNTGNDFNTICNAIREIECETNTTDDSRGIIKEIQTSEVTDTSVIVTDHASDNGNARLSKQNNAQSLVNSDTAGTPTKLDLRRRKHTPYLNDVLSDSEDDSDDPVKRKRGRPSRIEQNPGQIEESDSVATSIGNGQNQKQNQFGESPLESDTDDEESEYEWEQSADGSDDKSGTNTETLINKTGAHYKCKENHRESNEIKVQSNSRPKAHPHSKKKGQGMSNIGLKRAVDGEKRLKCKMCHYATNNRSHFTRHMRRHTGERPFKCKMCNYAASQRGNLIAHERIHSGEKPYKCRLCNYAAAQNVHLIEHIRIHTGEKPYKCRFCQFASTRSSSLNQHMRTQRHKATMKLHTASSKKDAERNMLKKSGKID
ncbi:zinc-finger double domain-containing protein [Ditylenchus destructor]|nr:zinc-finger double domain-containing protein [Ditylenchus destructor]